MPKLSKRCLAAALLSLPALQARAQPQGAPLTLVVGFAAGGGTDGAARLMAPFLSEELGQPVVVDNRTGGAGAIGAAAVIRAAPDGQTLFFGSGSELVLLPLLRKVPPYDTLAAFRPVAEVGTVTFVLGVAPSLGVHSVAELVDLARRKPEELAYASFGIGSTNHLIGELFAARTGTRLLHVPYRGSAAAVTDLIAGQVQLAFDTTSVLLPYIRSGTLMGLASLSAQRSDLAPDLPTMAESGVPDLAVEGWLGVLAPSATPPATVARLNAAINKVLRIPAVSEALRQRGVGVATRDADGFRAFIAEETRKWRDIIALVKVQMD